MKGKRVALYIRVSTMNEDQDTSIETQRKQKDIIEASGAKNITVYEDRISGGSTNRPEFNRMIADAKAGKIDVIYTKNLSRFARNAEFLLKTIREMEELGVVVIFAEDGIRTDREMSKLIITILGAVAEMEKENTAEHIRQAMEIKRLNGIPARLHSVPYGYRWNKDKKIVEIIPEEAEVVSTIFRWFVSEQRSCDSICKQLNREKILKRGRKWERSSLQYLIKNPRYRGVVVEGEYTFEGVIPRIIDPLVWAQANQRLTERKKSARNTKENFQVNRYPLSGKVFCRQCGMRCTRTSHPSPYKEWQGLVDDGNGKIQVWVCMSTTDRAKYPQHENVPSISEYYLYKAIIKVIAAMQITGKISVPETASAELSYSTKLKAYESRKKRNEKARERIYEAYESGVYTQERMKKALLKIEQDEATNVPPTPPDEVRYPSVEKFKMPEYDLDFSSDPVARHLTLKWRMQYLEIQLLDAFQKENTKREWVEATIEKIELDARFTFYIYTKQGYIFEVKCPSRAPGHSRKTGELRPGRLEITPLT